MDDRKFFRELLQSQPDKFLDAVESVKGSITKTVMAGATTDEDRAKALAEYHAIERIMKRLRASEG